MDQAKADLDVFWILTMVFVAVVPLAFLMKTTAPHTGEIHMDLRIALNW